MIVSASQSIERSDWDSVASSFEDFFHGLGTVEIEGGRASFKAQDTGFELDRDGTSQSFMPLHESNLVWDRVTFDQGEMTVTLTDGRSSYRYRVPERLVDRRPSPGSR